MLFFSLPFFFFLLTSAFHVKVLFLLIYIYFSEAKSTKITKRAARKKHVQRAAVDRRRVRVRSGPAWQWGRRERSATRMESKNAPEAVKTRENFVYGHACKRPDSEITPDRSGTRFARGRNPRRV